MSLFHQDNESFFDYPMLRTAARKEVEDSSLIMRAANGERKAAESLQRGFWGFVRQFEVEIAERINSKSLPREPLYAKFGRREARTALAGAARNIKNLQKSEIEGVFNEAERALLEMQHEEATHAAHWAADARHLGISRAELDRMPLMPGIKALNDAARAEDIVEFFARSLAATEFIAEELGDVLARNDRFTKLFGRRRAIWMEVHTIPHDEGPSHADIVLDFARAYSRSDSPERIHKFALEGMCLFGAAAREVEEHFCPVTKVAAE